MKPYCLEIYLSSINDVKTIDRFISDSLPNEVPLIFPCKKTGFFEMDEMLYVSKEKNDKNILFMLICLIYAEGKLHYDGYVDKDFNLYTEQSFKDFLNSDQYKKLKKIAEGSCQESWKNKPMLDSCCINSLKKILTRNYN